MALGLLRALAEEGVRVPDQVSVVGFDAIPEGAYANPPLTTVRQDFSALGRQCIETMLDLIHSGAPNETVPIRPELVVRQSAVAPGTTTRVTSER
jgi:DNA-binding LacI/PurR family transcriptional regulator